MPHLSEALHSLNYQALCCHSFFFGLKRRVVSERGYLIPYCACINRGHVDGVADVFSVLCLLFTLDVYVLCFCFVYRQWYRLFIS